VPRYPPVPILLSLRPISFLRQPILHNFGSVSPLAATLMDPLANVANKRLALWLSLLDATHTENIGGEGGCISSFLGFFTRLLPRDSSSFPSCSCALFCAFLQPGRIQLLSSQAIPYSLHKTRGGGGCSSTKTKQFRRPGSFSYNRPALCGSLQTRMPCGRKNKRLVPRCVNEWRSVAGGFRLSVEFSKTSILGIVLPGLPRRRRASAGTPRARTQ